MEKLVYIVRHGQTDFNLKGIVQGQGVDTSLNDTGRQQAKAFYDFHHRAGFDAVLTSRLKRTHETVAPFINDGLPWEQFAALNEIGWGEHEGKVSTPDMHQEYFAVVNAWKAGDYHARLEGGESAADVGERLAEFVSHLQQRPEPKILVCSHGRAMRALMCLLAGQPLSRMDEYQHANTGLYKTAYEGTGFRFLLQNDLSHLDSLKI